MESCELPVSAGNQTQVLRTELGPLQEQQASLTSEPPLQPISAALKAGFILAHPYKPSIQGAKTGGARINSGKLRQETCEPMPKASLRHTDTWLTTNNTGSPWRKGTLAGAGDMA